MASLKGKIAKIADGQSDLGFDPMGTGQPMLANVPIEQIEPDPDQPRKDVGNIQELMASIKEHGILQPIILSIIAEDQFRLIAGERRFTAAKALGLETVPSLIRTIEEHRRLEVQLVENIHRKELNAIEEASAFQRLIDEFKLSQRQLAQRLGKSPASINQTLRILSLPTEIIDSVQTSERLSRSVLLEIAKLPTAKEQLDYWHQAMNGGITVKEARAKKTGEISAHSPRTRIPIKTVSAVVTVVFEREGVGTEEVRQALREALAFLDEEGEGGGSSGRSPSKSIANSDASSSKRARRGAS